MLIIESCYAALRFSYDIIALGRVISKNESPFIKDRLIIRVGWINVHNFKILEILKYINYMLKF